MTAQPPSPRFNWMAACGCFGVLIGVLATDLLAGGVASKSSRIIGILVGAAVGAIIGKLIDRARGRH